MIKYILLLFLIFVILFMIKNKKSIIKSAFEKIFYISLFLFILYSIFKPEITTQIANFIGVGRGTDLLLYTFIIVSLYLNVSLIIEVKRDKRILLNHLIDNSIKNAITKHPNWIN